MKVNKSDLNKIATHPLQTSFWAEFRREWGNEILETEYGILTLHKLPALPYKIGMFIKGPVPTQEMVDALLKIAKEENLIFIKLEPNYVIKKGGISCADEQKVISMLKKVGAVPGKTIFTPTTFWIDLTKSEKELLASFHPKTRYNIRYALKRGVEVVEDNSDKAFEKYIELTRETVQRQGFYAHSEKYHRLMWKYLYHEPRTMNHEPIAHLLTAKYNDAIITTWILFVWKNFLYYPYGASSEKYKNVMANNLMMWEAIKFGKKLGLKTFDLWGREEGKGFTRFKEGYNPQVVEFLGTWDIVTSPLYWPYRVAEALRWALLRIRSKFKNPSF